VHAEPLPANTERVSGTDRPAAHRTNVDGSEPTVDDLRCELFDEPLADCDGPVGRTDVTTHPSTRLFPPAEISYAAVEFELDLMRKRLAIWDIFGRHIRAGAKSWPEVQRALTSEDLSDIAGICDGRSLRDLLVHLR
jgi:hypothetical protein